MIRKILTHLNVYEGKKKQLAPPATAPEYTEPIERAPYDDGLPGYEELVFEFKKFKNRQWIELLKVGGYRAESTAFYSNLLRNMLNNQNCLKERLKEDRFRRLMVGWKEFTEKFGCTYKAMSYHPLFPEFLYF